MTELADQIRAAFSADQASGRIARLPDDIPISYEAISDDWLTAILCAQVPGAKVVGHRLDLADDGTNNRRRIFLDYNEAGEAAGLPASVFCKATHGLNNRLMLGHSGAILCETTFYNHARAMLDIEAPRAWIARYDPVSFNSILVFEDFAGNAEFCDQDTPVDRTFAESQLDLLANVHSRFYEASELDRELAVLPTWYDRFHNLARFHLEESCRIGFAEAESVIPPGLFRRAEEIWPATLRSLTLQRDLPRCLCHGDVHLKNWYVTSAGGIGLGDWGVTHKGHWSRDLVYALTTSLTVENRRAWERDLVRYYLDRMAAAGVPPISFDDAFVEYRRALMTAFAFWTMTLNPPSDMPDMQPPETSLVFIGRLATAVDDLDSLALC